MSEVLGVGIIGTGPVTQALHIPALARLPECFTIRHLSSPSERTAPAVAAWVGARCSNSVDDLLADPAVDVVAINSPPALHAEHAIAAIKAGKRALLVEKPLATTLEDAVRVVELAEQTGTVLLVGTMHVFDPAWTRASHEFAELIHGAQFIRTSVVLPPNSLFEDWSGQVQCRNPHPPALDFSIPPIRAAIVQAVSVNLAIHDLPLIRSALPDWRDVEVRSAQPLAPFGHHQHLTCGSKRIQLLANMHRHRWSQWSTSFESSAGSVTVGFTPSFVPAGSGTITVRTLRGEIRIGASPTNGYEEEWRHLHAILTKGAKPAQTARTALEDLDFAMRIGAQAAIKAQEILA